MAKRKSIATADEPRGKGVSDDRGKSINWHTWEAIYFDPKLMPLPNLRDVFEYLAKNGVQVPPEIMVELCPLKTNVTVVPPNGVVFIHPLILALGMKLPLTASTAS